MRVTVLLCWNILQRIKAKRRWMVTILLAVIAGMMITACDDDGNEPVPSNLSCVQGYQTYTGPNQGEGIKFICTSVQPKG